VFDRFIDHVPGSPRNPLGEEWVLAKFEFDGAAAAALRA
jgi:hypothetical protein